MTLNELLDHWRYANRHPECGGRRQDWRNSRNPRIRWLFKACQNDILSTRLEDFCNTLKTRMPRWLRTAQGEGREGHPSTRGQPHRLLRVLRAHVLCTLLLLFRRDLGEKDSRLDLDGLQQLRAQAMRSPSLQPLLDELQDAWQLPPGFLLDLIDDLKGASEDPAKNYTRRTRGQRLRAPFALVKKGDGARSPDSSDPAILAAWVLELVEHGPGDVYLSPRQSLLNMDRDFLEFETEVPGDARSFLKNQPGLITDCDVRLEIEFLESRDLLAASLEGNSATGALLRGLCLIWSGAVDDSRVIVMASSRGGVKHESVAPKVEAVIRHNRPPDGKGPVRPMARTFERIVMATAENCQEARRILRAWNIEESETVVECAG